MWLLQGWHHTRQPHSVSNVSKKTKKYLLYFSPLLRCVVAEKSLTKSKASLFRSDSFYFDTQKLSISERKTKRIWQITNIFNWLFLPGHWRLEVCCHGSGQAVSLDICPCLCPGDCWIISATTFSKPHCCHKPLAIILNVNIYTDIWSHSALSSPLLTPQRGQVSCTYIF